MRQINIRNIKLTEKSFEKLSKIEDTLYDTVAYAIEDGDWYLPSETYEYVDIKKKLTEELASFFKLDQTLIEIEDFFTHIVSYEKGHK